MLRIAYSPVYKHELPVGHGFPMAKYELLPEQLLYEGTVQDRNFFHPDLLAKSDALLTHTESNWEKLTRVTLSEREVRARSNSFRVAQDIYF